MTATATTTTVTVPRSEIARGLKAGSSIKAKAVRFDLSGEHVAIYAFSSEVATRITLDAAGNPGAGAVSVPRPLIAGVMPYIGHDIVLSIADEHLIVRSGDSEFQIRALREDPPPAESAPSNRHRRRSFNPSPAAITATFGHDLGLDGETFTESFAFDAPVLVETFRRALPFAGTDMTRPLLCNVAVYPDANVAAATDSYRLAVVRYGDESSKPEKDPLLFNTEGAKSMHALLGKKLGTVTVAPIDRFLIIDFEDTRWSLRRQMPYGDDESVRYPQWWDLIPDADAKVTTTIKVDREDMLAASRSARVVGSRNTPLILRAHAKGASVAANALTAAKMTRRLSSAGVIGSDMEIGFNPEFMADICTSAPVERIAVKLIGPLRPALVEVARDQYLLMPIRLNV